VAGEPGVEQARRLRAGLHAEPVPQSADGAVHAVGPDRAGGGAEPVWVCGWGPREFLRSLWALCASSFQLSGLGQAVCRTTNQRGERCSGRIGSR
jgi:hypothetical protein